MIRINLQTATRNSEQEQKMVWTLALEMADAYNFPRNKIQVLFPDHSASFCNWLAEEYETKAVPFQIGTVAFGFTFYDAAFVTAMLLKTPAGRLQIN